LLRSESKVAPDLQASWTSRSIGSGLQHRIFYELIRFGGRPAAYLLLYLVVLYYMLFRPTVRRRTHPYLAHRFPRSGVLRRWRESYLMSLSLGQVLIDRAAVGILGPGYYRVRLRGEKELKSLLAEGRGLVLMTAHVGCWQVALSCLGLMGASVNLLMVREEADIDRHYYEHAGLDCPFRLIDAKGFLGGSLEMLECLRRGEALLVMGDRMLGSGRNAVAANFLGEPAPFPYSSFKLASASGAPIAVLLSYKTGPRSYELKLAKVIRVPEGLGRGREQFQPYVAQFANALEEFVGEHPFQFFNFYDMWGQEQAR
jgi:predicted LPLAT superfamily acyltransferase